MQDCIIARGGRNAAFFAFGAWPTQSTQRRRGNMATVHVVFHKPMQGIASVHGAIPNAKQTITSSASSQATTAAASAGDVATITATGGNVWVKTGAAPTASAGNDWLIVDGQSLDLGGLSGGDVVAVIDA